MGLKTTYYLRSVAATTIEKSVLDINVWKEQSPRPRPVSIEIAMDASQNEAPAVSPQVCAIDDPECESCQ